MKVTRTVINGIPQGGVWGTLLFVVFINDMPQEIQSQIYMFADDTKIYRELNSLDKRPNGITRRSD